MAFIAFKFIWPQLVTLEICLGNTELGHCLKLATLLKSCPPHWSNPKLTHPSRWISMEVIYYSYLWKLSTMLKPYIILLHSTMGKSLYPGLSYRLLLTHFYWFQIVTGNRHANPTPYCWNPTSVPNSYKVSFQRTRASFCMLLECTFHQRSPLEAFIEYPSIVHTLVLSPL